MSAQKWRRRNLSVKSSLMMLGGILLTIEASAYTQIGEERTFDGSGNNQQHPDWGRAGAPLIRRAGSDYADGQSEPSGASRPSARAISQAVCAQDGDQFNRRRASDFVWQWGQFLDHDLDLTDPAHPEEPFDIEVPAGDPYFDPSFQGDVVIALSRSVYARYPYTAVREQVNDITAFIDASNVYGSDEERALALRTLDGTGRLKVSADGLLPYNTEGLPNAPDSEDTSFFLAGDIRANEQVGLTCMHTLFVREHNYLADRLREIRPELSGEEVYQFVRAVVGAEMQAITYREFLPILLGQDALSPYQGYRADVNPTIANEFSTAAYRFGHSMLSPNLLRLDAAMDPIEEGHLFLDEAFFAPSEVVNHGIEPYLRGLSNQLAQRVDTLIIDDVRNFLFGPPGAGGFDLASLNIQRGRDHGLPDYNSMRRAYGLSSQRRFSDITDDRQVARQLRDVYGDIDQIDPWLGGLAEDEVRGGLVGELVYTVLKTQFEALRDGDRFWYQRSLPATIIAFVEEQTLARIIRRNTEIGDEISDDVFRVLPDRERRPRGE